MILVMALLVWMPPVATLQEQAAWRDSVAVARLDALVPVLLDRADLDAWVLIGAEYNEDPVLKTMLPATWLSARRTTILLFARNAETGAVERMAVARYPVGRLFPSAWDPDSVPDPFVRTAQLLERYDPARIGINISERFDHANGLTKTEHDRLVDALPPRYLSRLVSAEAAAVGWLETRTPAEQAKYVHINEVAHAIVEEGLRGGVIEPGRTTTDGLEWWFRERVRGLGLETWFHPGVSLQRREGRPMDDTLRAGDLVHVDFGITYFGLNTDTQRMVYLPEAGETGTPAALRAAFAQGNRLQDILMEEMATQPTGNAALRVARERAIAEGLRPSIYTHPIGYHGHAAGSTVGMWDKQEGVPGDGDHPIFPETAWSIELNVTVAVPGWGDVRIALEEDALFTGGRLRFIAGRQEGL